MEEKYKEPEPIVAPVEHPVVKAIEDAVAAASEPPAVEQPQVSQPMKISFLGDGIGAIGTGKGKVRDGFDPLGLEKIFTEKRNRNDDDFSDGFDFEYDGDGKAVKAIVPLSDIEEDHRRTVAAMQGIDAFYDRKAAEYGPDGPKVTPEEEEAMNAGHELPDTKDI